MVEDGVHCACFSIILVGSVVRVSKTFCPQKPLEECKYTVKKDKQCY